MFSLAIRWRWRPDNPCRGIERNPENKRTRYLSSDELGRLTAALAAHEDQQAANIIRLLLLTGARKGETLAAKWEDFDLEAGVWTKPGATTKQATEHRVPLSAPARQLLAGMPREGEYLFPGARARGHRVDLKGPWPAICKAANLKGVRLHDLRHTYASVLASSGQSLHVIGALLGHTQPSTTHRYAHLLDDPLRAATETAGAVITGAPKARVARVRP
jgi:integrase